MAKQLEAFAKDYAALLRELDSAGLQLKEAEQHRAQHDGALRDQAQALGRRVGALRAAGSAGAGSGLEAFKTDAEVQRLLAGLNEVVARAEAERLRYHGLAVGAWPALLTRAAGLEKELAAEIAVRQKQSTAKTGLGNKSLGELVLLQLDMRKKVGARRTALQTGEKALVFHKDPEYFRKRRDEWQAAALSPAATAPKKLPAAAPITAKAVPQNGSTPNAGASTATPAKAAAAVKPAAAPPAAKPTPAAASPTPAKAAATEPAPAAAGDGLLTVETFKIAGAEARAQFARLRASVVVARRAARNRDGEALADAKAEGAEHMEHLEGLVKRYELARQETGDQAIGQLPGGRQILIGIRALLAVRTRARAMLRALANVRIT